MGPGEKLTYSKALYVILREHSDREDLGWMSNC